MTTWLIIAWLLLATCALACCFWAIVWVRVSRYVRDRPTVRAGLDVATEVSGEWPSLSIVVPAHNEEAVIGACCESLRQQDYPGRLEIILVLDRCTDRTIEIAQRHGADDSRLIVIENGSCPADWAGKCNAARLGAERATGEHLVFTDADTQFDPALCRAAVALAIQRNIALLSLLSTLTYEKPFEKVAQPVATMQLMRLYPPMRQSSDRPARPFANGQFMLFPRKWYERIGGHVAVKDDLLEDLAFAVRVKDAGGRVTPLLADGMLRCAMYETLEEFRTGWKRIYIEACRRKPKRLRKHARRLILTGALMPAAQVGASVVAIGLLASGVVGLPVALLGVVLAGWITQFTALARAYALGGAPRWAALAYPAGCWIVAQAMFEGASDLARRRPVKWGGREYVLEPRG